MKNNAQSALEYLMTYGWTLIVIAVVIGTLVFILSPPNDVSFSSDDLDILVKDGYIGGGGEVDLVLQNATGGSMTISGVYLSGDLAGLGEAKLNENNISSISASSPLVVPSAADLKFDDIYYAGLGSVEGQIDIEYSTRFGLNKVLVIKAGGKTNPTEKTIDACGDITTTGIYTLSNNINTAAGNCLDITADDVILNCEGKRIETLGSYAVYITGDNVTVTNCQLSGQNTIRASGVTGCNINNNDIAASSFGVLLFSASNCVVRNNTIVGIPSYGICSLNLTNTIISGNESCSADLRDFYCSGGTVTGTGNRGNSSFGCTNVEISPCP